MYLASILLHAAYFGCASRAIATLIARHGSSGPRRVAMVLATTMALHAGLFVAYFALDDMLGDMDARVLAASLLFAGAPWLLHDVLRLRSGREPYPQRGRAREWLLRAVALAPVLLVGGIAIATAVWLRPRSAEDALAVAEEVRSHADVCESRAECEQIVDLFAARVERGDITLRALFLTRATADIISEHVAMDDEGALTMLRYFDAVDAYDGQPPPLDAYFDVETD